MQTLPNCDCHTRQGASAPSFVSFHPGSVHAFASASASVAAAGFRQTAEAVHISAQGDRIYSASFVDGAGKGTVHLKGNIGFIPFELDVDLELADGKLRLTLELIEPFKAGPLTWVFDVSGNGVALAQMPSFASAGPGVAIDYLCALKCGAVAILPTLVACVPAFVTGGPAGYIACVTSKVGGADAAAIAACIAEKCL